MCLLKHLFRGENIDFGQRNWSARQLSFETVTDGNPVLPASSDFERSYDDMLIAYSTLPGDCLVSEKTLYHLTNTFLLQGYVSYREESEGTWFIKALCVNFMKYAHEYHVERLLQYVSLGQVVYTMTYESSKCHSTG